MINGDNYVVWSISIKKVLLANSCLLIEPGANATAAAKQSYETRKTTALRILNASILETFYNTISATAERQDPAGIWDACKVFDRSQNSLFYDNTRELFNRLKFDPKEETIR